MEQTPIDIGIEDVGSYPNLKNINNTQIMKTLSLLIPLVFLTFGLQLQAQEKRENNSMQKFIRKIISPKSNTRNFGIFWQKLH